jgi:RNA polymerase sigma factor (sigma-70 family)
MSTDSELLASFVRDRSEDALRTLFERYLKLVYAAAIRQVRDPAMAEDIVQGTFMALTDKAPRLSARGVVLPTWLLTVTHYAALNALKRRAVRLRYEKKGAIMENQTPATVNSENLGSIIDAAMNLLSGSDRTAIAIFYLENRSLRDVAAELAVSEAAAQKRVGRALLRLRAILRQRGFTCPADALEASLHKCNAVVLPPALLAAALNSALRPAMASSGGMIAAQDILRKLLMKKIKGSALGVLAAAMVLAVVIPLTVHAFSDGRSVAAQQLAGTAVQHSSDAVPRDSRAAWEAAGAQSGWMNQQGAWDDSANGRRGEIPAFLFKQWTPGVISRLPPPALGFGLVLNSTNITDADVKELTGLTRLRQLNLSGTQVTDTGLHELASLTQLQGLGLGYSHVTDAGTNELVSLIHLRWLSLGGIQMTNSGMKQLAGLTQLQALDLIDTGVTDADLEQLARLTQLQWLNLSNNNVTQAGLKQLEGLTQLHVLILKDTHLKDTDLHELAGFRQLQWLWLEGTQVDDAGINELAACTQLQGLDLSGTQITDAGLQKLTGLVRLKKLYLGATQVTDAGVAELKNALPKLQIIP